MHTDLYTRPARARRGFTLLELVVSIAMVAILSVGLYTTLSIAFDARDRVREQTAAPTRAAIALTTIRHELEQAMPMTQVDTGIVGPMIGTASSVEFYRTGRDTTDAESAAADTLSEGVRWTALSLEFDDASGTAALVRRIDRNLLSERPVEPEPQVLLTGLTGLVFRYYDGSGWADSWDSTQNNNGLPLAIEVTVEVPQETRLDPVTGEPQPYAFTQFIPISAASEATLLGEGE